MDTREKVLAILFEALGEILEEKGIDISDKQPLSIQIYGQGGVLDSLALVRLAVEVEEVVNEEFDKDIVIVDDRAMSQKRSPFRTVESLVDYLVVLLEEDNEID